MGGQHFTWGSRLGLEDGSALDARVLIDASGATSRLVKGGGPPAAFQSAFGLVARFDEPPIPPGTCTLMDWSPSPAADDEAIDPTFLYAMDLGGDRFLVEETSLARRRPLDTTELSSRAAGAAGRCGGVTGRGAVGGGGAHPHGRTGAAAAARRGHRSRRRA